jgi:hypothetical protein
MSKPATETLCVVVERQMPIRRKGKRKKPRSCRE